MAVRMANVHFADVPFHIGRRPGHVEALFKAFFVNRIDIVDPNRHPDAAFLAIVASRAEGHRHIALAAATLAIQAKKYLTFTRTDTTECRRVAPVPTLFPTKLFKPFYALCEI